MKKIQRNFVMFIEIKSRKNFRLLLKPRFRDNAYLRVVGKPCDIFTMQMEMKNKKTKSKQPMT